MPLYSETFRQSKTTHDMAGANYEGCIYAEHDIHLFRLSATGNCQATPLKTELVNIIDFWDSRYHDPTEQRLVGKDEPSSDS